MAHEITVVDSMISGRFITPWHGLGEVTGDFGIEDLRRIMGWSVIKVPLQTTPVEDVFSDFTFHNVKSLMTDKYATVRLPYGEVDEPIVLGAGLSDSYKVLQNTDLIKVIEPFVEQGCMLETAGTLKQGRKVWVMLRLSSEINVGSDDNIKQYILASNDHTGAQAAKFGLIGVRVVCNNTLTLAESSKDAQLIRIIHQGDVNKNMQTVASMLNHVNGRFENYSHDLNLLAKSGINEKDLRKMVKDCFYNLKDQVDPKLALRILQTENNVVELFETGAGSDLISAKGTVYGAYQAINHYLNHNRDIALETRLSSMVWGGRAAIDKTAFNMAMRLAA